MKGEILKIQIDSTLVNESVTLEKMSWTPAGMVELCHSFGDHTFNQCRVYMINEMRFRKWCAEVAAGNTLELWCQSTSNAIDTGPGGGVSNHAQDRPVKMDPLKLMSEFMRAIFVHHIQKYLST